MVGTTRIQKPWVWGGEGGHEAVGGRTWVSWEEHGGNPLHSVWDGERHKLQKPIWTVSGWSQLNIEWCCRLVVTAQGFDGRLLHAAQQLVSMHQAQCASPAPHTPTAGSLAPPFPMHGRLARHVWIGSWQHSGTWCLHRVLPALLLAGMLW